MDRLVNVFEGKKHIFCRIYSEETGLNSGVTGRGRSTGSDDGSQRPSTSHRSDQRSTATAQLRGPAAVVGRSAVRGRGS